MNRKIIFYSILIVVLLFLIHGYINNPKVGTTVAKYTESDFSEENIYSDMESLSERFEQEAVNGSDSFTVYLKDMDVAQIHQINEIANGIYGTGTSYTQDGTVAKGYQKVTITMKHTPNYYVLQAYLNGKTIPQLETKAKEMYAVVKTILDTQISPNMSDYQKELILHDYLTTHCKYSDEQAMSLDSDVYRAYGALVNQNAVCNGYAEAMEILLRCAGVNSRFVIGTADGVDHAWNLVELDGKWYHMDATWDDPVPDQEEKTIHAYFNVSDEIISKNHQWKRENYPVADDMDYNYYVQTNSYFKNYDEYRNRAVEQMVYNGVSRYEAVIENYHEKEEDMQFVFTDDNGYHNVSWQTFHAGKYCVLVLKAE